MAWDFSTEPEFQEKLDWVDQFCREEIEPLELVFPYAVRMRDPKMQALVDPLRAKVKEQGLWAIFLDKELGGPGFGQRDFSQPDLGDAPLDFGQHDGACRDEFVLPALAPPAETFRAEARDHRIRVLALTPGSEHATGKPGAAARAELCAPLEHLHRDPALGQLQRAGESCDACTDDADLHGFQPCLGEPAGTYSSLPLARNFADICAMPCVRASARTS